MKIEILERAVLQYPNHAFPWHVHPRHHTLSRVISGAALLETPGQCDTVVAGDMVFIPAGLSHRTLVQNNFSYELIRFRLAQNEQSYSYLCTATTDTEWSSFFADQCLNHGALAEQFQTDGTPRPLPDPAIQRCLNYLQSHYTERLQVEDLGRVALRSVSHLLRTFKQQVGISPSRYLLGLKIDKAKAMMQQGTSLADVAFETGFYDQSHFHRYFRLYTGLTPRQYQYKLRE